MGRAFRCGTPGGGPYPRMGPRVCRTVAARRQTRRDHLGQPGPRRPPRPDRARWGMRAASSGVRPSSLGRGVRRRRPSVPHQHEVLHRTKVTRRFAAGPGPEGFGGARVGRYGAEVMHRTSIRGPRSRARIARPCSSPPALEPRCWPWLRRLASKRRFASPKGRRTLESVTAIRVPAPGTRTMLPRPSRTAVVRSLRNGRLASAAGHRSPRIRVKPGRRRSGGLARTSPSPPTGKLLYVHYSDTDGNTQGPTSTPIERRERHPCEPQVPILQLDATTAEPQTGGPARVFGPDGLPLTLGPSADGWETRARPPAPGHASGAGNGAVARHVAGQESLRIAPNTASSDPAYTVAARQPVLSPPPTRKPEIWSYGLLCANPWRFSFEPRKTGRPLDRPTVRPSTSTRRSTAVLATNGRRPRARGVNFGWKTGSRGDHRRTGRRRTERTPTPPVYEIPHGQPARARSSAAFVYRGSRHSPISDGT